MVGILAEARQRNNASDYGSSLRATTEIPIAALLGLEPIKRNGRHPQGFVRPQTVSGHIALDPVNANPVGPRPSLDPATSGPTT